MKKDKRNRQGRKKQPKKSERLTKKHRLYLKEEKV